MIAKTLGGFSFLKNKIGIFAKYFLTNLFGSKTANLILLFKFFKNFLLKLPFGITIFTIFCNFKTAFHSREEYIFSSSVLFESSWTSTKFSRNLVESS